MKKNIIRMIVVWITIIMLCIFSCWRLYVWLFIPKIAYIPKTSGIRPVWIDKMLHHPTCELPCWENITPGVTLMDDGTNLLYQIPGIHVTYSSYQNGDDEYHTEWLFDSENNPNVGMANSRSTDGIIYNIILNLNFESYMPVGDFIDVYGQPEYLDAYHCDGLLCIFRLVYPDVGTMLELELPGKGLFPGQQDKSRIEKNSAVEAIILFPKGMDYFYFSYLGYRTPLGSPLVKWQGYGVYDYQGNFNP